METTTETAPAPVALTPAQKRAATNAAKKAKLAQVGQTPAPKAPKAVIAPVFTEEETPEHTIEEVKPDKKMVFGHTHNIIFRLPSGETRTFAHKGKPKPTDILAIHRAMMVKYNREAELKAQAAERHREAMKRFTGEQS